MQSEKSLKIMNCKYMKFNIDAIFYYFGIGLAE